MARIPARRPSHAARRGGRLLPLLSPASVLLAALLACSRGDPPGRPGGGKAEGHTAEWPEAWATDFALRCASAGEDVRFCACVASEVQKRWTPEQFKARGADRLEAEMQACRERIDFRR